MQRASLIGLLALACVGVASAAAAEADLQPEIRRGFLAVGHSTSDVPALRVEAAHATPSAGFALGAALGGWINAAATLDYDLKTPSGDGDDSETIHLDCIDEAAMLQRLEQL